MGEKLFRDGRFVDPSVGREPVGDALLARDGRIVRVGRLDECRAAAGPGTEEIDLAGRTAIPGLVDAHIHLRSVGEVLDQCNLLGARSRQEALELLAAFAAAHPGRPWVRARGYQLNAWEDASYPTARQLDEAVSDRPCLAIAFDGHSVWLNSRAMRAAGVGRDTPDPPGGAILRDGRSEPTGCLLESATDLAHAAVPPDGPDEVARQLRAAIEELARHGHTAAHSMMWRADWPIAEAAERLAALYPAGRCPLRLRLFAPFSQLPEVAAAAGAAPAGPDALIRVAGIKVFLDGSLGSRTCWMFEPFEGEPANCGIATLAPAELRRRIAQANRAGVPLLCHAIGDRACAEALAAFLAAGDRRIGNRIEHAQFLRPADLGLFARAGVAASVQPPHLWTDWRPADRLLGPRRTRWAFAFGSLLEAGAVLAMGSDAPVVPARLQASLHAAVTRSDQALCPPGGWHAEECISPPQWAAAASAGAWQSIGEGGQLGRLLPGFACDLTVLDRDVLDPACGDFLNWRAAATVVAGCIHWWT